MPDEIGELVDRFEQAWEGAEPPDVATFLGCVADRRSDESFWRRLVWELVCVDLEHRWRRYGTGEQETVAHRQADAGGRVGLPTPPRLEHYVGRFPELGAADDIPLQAVVREFRVRHYWGDRPAIRGYASRFAHLHGQLETALSQVLAEVTPLALCVYYRQRLTYATRLGTAMEIGRQQSGEPPPYSESVTDVGVRLIMAPSQERKISRRHVGLQRLPSGVVRVTSLTTKGDIGLGPNRLPPGGTADAALPMLLVLGQYAIRVESNSES